MVVISIIAMLSSVVLVSVQSARIKARNTARFQSVKQLINALELYRTANGKYPNTHTFSGGTYGVGNPLTYNIVWYGKCTGTCYFTGWTSGVRNDTSSDFSDGLGAALLPYVDIGKIPVENTKVSLVDGTGASWGFQSLGIAYYKNSGIDYPGINAVTIIWAQEGSGTQCPSPALSGFMDRTPYYLVNNPTTDHSTLCEIDLLE